MDQDQQKTVRLQNQRKEIFTNNEVAEQEMCATNTEVGAEMISRVSFLPSLPYYYLLFFFLN